TAGVLGHELAHVRNRDVLLFTIMAAFVGSVGILAALAWRAIRGTRVSRRSKSSSQVVVALLAIAIVLWLASWLGRLLKLAVSRATTEPVIRLPSVLSYVGPTSLCAECGPLTDRRRGVGRNERRGCGRDGLGLGFSAGDRNTIHEFMEGSFEFAGAFYATA